MAKMSKKLILNIIKKDMPGYEIVDVKHKNDSDAPLNAPEAFSPPLVKIFRKYRSENEKQGSDFIKDAQKPEIKKSDLEDVIVHVKIKGKDIDAGKMPATKAVVISGSKKKIIGQQG